MEGMIRLTDFSTQTDPDRMEWLTEENQVRFNKDED